MSKREQNVIRNLVSYMRRFAMKRKGRSKEYVYPHERELGEKGKRAMAELEAMGVKYDPNLGKDWGSFIVLSSHPRSPSKPSPEKATEDTDSEQHEGEKEDKSK